jgi:hypothetical protein
MRLIKMVGPAMVAAIAAMAFLGAGSASATTTALCNKDPGASNLCPTGSQLSGLLNVDGLQILGDGILETSLGKIRCENIHFKAHVPNASLAATSILGKITELVYLFCESKISGCSGKVADVTTTVVPEIHLLYLQPGLGELKLEKPSTTVVFLNCPLIGNVTCKFAENDTVVGLVHNLHDEGAGPKELPVGLFTEAPVTGPGGGICPKTAKLTTTFDLTYLLTVGGVKDPLFIAQ